MTILQALAILESATLECKKRDADTPEAREALDLLEPYVRPEGLFRSSATRSKTLTPTRTNGGTEPDATRDFSREAVKVLLEVRMDALA